MEIPPLDRFRQQPGTAYGPPFSVDPQGAGFTLAIPEGDETWTPHEPSYRLALLVLPELEAMTANAVEHLGRFVDFARVGIAGEPYLNHVECDARASKVTLSMSWETDVYGEWSFTFPWQQRDDGVPRWPWPTGFAFRNR